MKVTVFACPLTYSTAYPPKHDSPLPPGTEDVILARKTLIDRRIDENIPTHLPPFDLVFTADTKRALETVSILSPRVINLYTDNTLHQPGNPEEHQPFWRYCANRRSFDGAMPSFPALRRMIESASARLEATARSMNAKHALIIADPLVALAFAINVTEGRGLLHHIMDDCMALTIGMGSIECFPPKDAEYLSDLKARETAGAEMIAH